jgi:hypothetical protein
MSANTRLAGNFTATGQSQVFTVSARDFLLKIGGTFVGTVQLEIYNGQAAAWQAVEAAYTAGLVKAFDAVARGQIFRLNCTAYTSGTISYELEAPND